MRAFWPIAARKWTGAVATLLLLSAVSAFAAVERVNFPLLFSTDGYFVAEVSINSSARIPAIIDTAATMAMIDRRAAVIAGIPAPAADEARVSVFGLLGEQQYGQVQISQLRAGTVSLHHFSAAYNDRETMPGGPLIIPAIAFGGDVIDFDFPVGQFSSYNGWPKRVGTVSPARSALTEVDGLYFAEISVNGVKGRALIDTGSPVSLMNSAFARAAGVPRNDEKSQILQGATGGKLLAHVATARQISIGYHTFRKMDMIVADPALFEDMGLQDEPLMLLGIDYLSQFRVQIDRKRSALLLTGAGAGRPILLEFYAKDTRLPN